VYRELVSASNCTDYQSRAMEVRYGTAGGKDAKDTAADKAAATGDKSGAAAASGAGAAAAAGGAAAGGKKYVHFLNATLCATTRTICCILENYQTPEGVKVPDVLVPFMGGRTFLKFTRPRPAVSAAVRCVGCVGWAVRRGQAGVDRVFWGLVLALGGRRYWSVWLSRSCACDSCVSPRSRIASRSRLTASPLP
jgi:hypothetical protein